MCLRVTTGAVEDQPEAAGEWRAGGESAAVTHRRRQHRRRQGLQGDLPLPL